MRLAALIIFLSLITLSVSANPLEQYQWGLEAINFFQAISQVPENHTRPLIAVIDTGIDVNHPDVDIDNLWNENGMYGIDLTSYATAIGCVHQFVFILQLKQCYAIKNSEAIYSVVDISGHGTHVAGILAAADNDVGIIGVSDAKLLIIKAIPSGNSVYSLIEMVAIGIVVATDLGADVISMSLGTSEDNAMMHAAVLYASLHDVVLVAAAGNYDSDVPIYPAYYEEVIAVSAINESLLPWKVTYGIGSNYGDWIDIAAPGANIISLQSEYQLVFGEIIHRGHGWLNMSGTSQATPHIAGTIALIMESNSCLSKNQIVDILYRTSLDLGTPGKDIVYGWGLVNAESAVKMALSYKCFGTYPLDINNV